MTAQDKVNILMVDDQPAKLLSYEAILAELGENLIKAHSGREALEILLRTDVAVVLMDVSMPEMDGFELADLIRQHPRCSHVAIIFISAVHLTDLDRLKGYQRGAGDYVSVPIDPEVLRAKVSVFADLHRKTRMLEMLNLELSHLSAMLINAQDDERRRLARELHDGLGQDLTAAKMLVDRLLFKRAVSLPESETVQQASEMLGHALQQIRGLSYLLHPPLLDEIGLQAALRSYLDGLEKRCDIRFSFDVRPAEFPRLATQIETGVFRIVQEAATNVYRHSGATRASVRLLGENGRLSLTISDDGKGVPEHIASLRTSRLGVGLGGMLQRVKELGGSLRLRNTHPGTLVEVLLPMQYAPAADASADSNLLGRAGASEMISKQPVT
jgi:signal transduction histidine kinase